MGSARSIGRVDVAEGEERRNLVFEYNIVEDTIYGVTEGATSVRAIHHCAHRPADRCYSICCRCLLPVFAFTLAAFVQRNANGRRGDHWVRSKGEAGTIAAALTVRVERTPFSASEQAPPAFETPPSQHEGHGGEL